MDEIASGAVAASARPAVVPQAVRRVARQLEASFATEMLRTARPQAKEGMFSGGIGARSFDSFMDEALGEAMMKQGGLGLSRQIEGSIVRAQRGAGAPAGGGTP